MKNIYKVSALLCAALACLPAFAVVPTASASASHELDLSVAFASDPSRVSYAFGVGSDSSGFPYVSGVGGASHGYSYSWPTEADDSVGTFTGNSSAIAAPTGHFGAVSELDDFTISFTNHSNRKRSVSFEADFSDILTALVGDPTTQAAGAAARYLVVDGGGHTVLQEYDRFVSGGRTSSVTNSYTDAYTFFLNASSSETFHVFVGDASEAVAAAPVPEPMTLGVLGVGLVALIRRRKKA